jgi:hypothetical protein
MMPDLSCYFFSLRCPNQISVAVNNPAASAALKLKVILMAKGNQAHGRGFERSGFVRFGFGFDLGDRQ